MEQKGWAAKLSRWGARTSRPVRLWCFFRILTSPVYARMLQCTSSSISPWKSTSFLQAATSNDRTCKGCLVGLNGRLSTSSCVSC